MASDGNAKGTFTRTKDEAPIDGDAGWNLGEVILLRTNRGERALGKNRQMGFTLVEHLIVVAILAVLAAVITPPLYEVLQQWGSRGQCR